ncbi:hypothetical protein KGF56_004119 [Candida oxycetoniae]|uniref:Amino acid transporter transmembrane domain-containing protein n=1 Tax=Candida oxycetoniae TaxID=497107 RepID=A0AAI9SV43_9ASCO|nr:uncharacterized protein KGF56_004119 [Candida oxycetoniae]KAI3403059.2 hypothetical protein KGF56_004119 [Candida oxycetoniae]
MGRATIKSGTINLLNTIIGAGILAMPYGLAQNGLVFGCMLIIWSSFTSAFGLYLQNKVAKYTEQRGSVSYFSLAQLTYPKLSILFDLAISIKCFGVGVSYLVVIGDLMPKIMETLRMDGSNLLMHRNFWITIFMAAVVTPLSYLKKLNSLKYTSFIALFSVAYLICLVVEKYIALSITKEGSSILSATTTTSAAANNGSNVFARSIIPHPAEHIVWFGPISFQKTLSSFPMFVFAYTCHQNMFAIINELKPHDKDGSQTRQSNLIIRNAICIALASYLVVGILGYLTFGSNVNANIISMYPKNSISSLIGRLCIVIMVSLSFPLQCHPCRGSINHVIHFITNGVESSTPSKRSGTTTTTTPTTPTTANSSSTNNTTERRSTNNGVYTSLSSDIESIGSLTDSTNMVDESFISTTPMEGAQDSEGHDPIVVPLTSKKFYIITSCIVVLSYLVAIMVTSLAKVLAFVGSTGSTSISFILPGVFGYFLIRPMNGATELDKLDKLCKYGGLALAIWGGAVMVICLSATIFLGATH